ncbi:MAG: DMT family transporter [Cyanobacteriota bacterium]|nr:DMT family transporter [Cyanobacteriota bacterium]
MIATGGARCDRPVVLGPLGVAAALAAALCWTLASGLWRSWPSALNGGRLNLLKTLIALATLLPLMLLLPWRLPLASLVLLAGSGAVGIAAGDTLFFAALRRLGTRRTLTVEAGAPALTTLLAALWLGEHPSGPQLLGIALISVAVLLVVRQQPLANAASTTPARQAWLGSTLALGAVCCGAMGALLARAAWRMTDLHPLQAATVRLLAAAVVLLPLLRGWPRPSVVLRWRHWLVPVAATQLGTVLGIVLQQVALGWLGGGPAVALMATAPLMALPLAVLEGDRAGWSGLVSACLGLLGVSLVAGWPWAL